MGQRSNCARNELPAGRSSRPPPHPNWRELLAAADEASRASSSREDLVRRPSWPSRDGERRRGPCGPPGARVHGRCHTSMSVTSRATNATGGEVDEALTVELPIDAAGVEPLALHLEDEGQHRVAEVDPSDPSVAPRVDLSVERRVARPVEDLHDVAPRGPRRGARSRGLDRRGRAASPWCPIGHDSPSPRASCGWGRSSLGSWQRPGVSGSGSAHARVEDLQGLEQVAGDALTTRRHSSRSAPRCRPAASTAARALRSGRGGHADQDRAGRRRWSGAGRSSTRPARACRGGTTLRWAPRRTATKLARLVFASIGTRKLAASSLGWSQRSRAKKRASGRGLWR